MGVLTITALQRSDCWKLPFGILTRPHEACSSTVRDGVGGGQTIVVLYGMATHRSR